MEKREEALREALVNNAEETSRWESYKEDNGTAVENLNEFSKFLTVDVMVPIGRKAYMPGHLIHTNEVLVGHYQNYFSKCSAHKAKELCEYRIKMAEDHLEKLKTESDLWQNKLDKPYTNGVFPSMDNHEIIENYDEDEEKIWREKHKVRVKQAKAREKVEREHSSDKGSDSNETKDLGDNDIFKMLEEAELMEELQNELDILDIDEVSNETIRKLMAGDMKLPPEKTRVSHIDKTDKVQNKNEINTSIEIANKNKEQKLQGIVKKREVVTNLVSTNNNNRSNPELVTSSNISNEISDSDMDDLPREVQIIKEQAKFLPLLDQIGFYEFQIKIMRQKLLTLPLKTQDDIDQKVHILNILETLEELLEITEDTAQAEEEEEQIINEKDATTEEISTSEKKIIINDEEKPLKRRISFALQNETLEFRKNETISEMLPKVQQQNKDIIKLDEGDLCSNIKISTLPHKVDRRKDILDRVEKNLRFIEENQSTKDFQLVDKILESSTGGCYTLRINYQHSAASENEVSRKNENYEDSYPGSPADLYEAYLKNKEKQDALETQTISQMIYANAYTGEDKVKVPHLRENDRVNFYEDQRLEFYKPIATEAKSILRNKSAVEREQHKLERKNRVTNNKQGQKKKGTAIVDEEQYMSAYYKVMNEVVEKPITEPEPLPECKYIDAHTPKKRISRFKQNRKVTEKI